MCHKQCQNNSRIRIFILLGLILLLFCATPSPGARVSSQWVKISPPRVHQGSITLLTFTGPKETHPLKITYEKRSFPFFTDKNGRRVALLGIPLSTRNRKIPLSLHVSRHGKAERIAFTLNIDKKRYPTRTIHLTKRVKLSAKTLEKIKRERKELLAVLNTVSAKRYWNGKFIKPVRGKITSPFGVRRKINGTYMSVHHGTDFRAHLKTPVHAVNSGTVVFIKKMVLSGLTIVIDHGMGLYSLYGHLSQAQVKLGETIKKNQVIGLSGNTGRSTGPHLHLGITISGISIDPISLIHLPL